ncbi:hypothetical protein Lser_V15G30248 [Lactuca serriola]
MKMSCCSEIEDDFFDAREVFVSMSDSDSERYSDDCCTSGYKYDSWIGNLDSVDERRNKFIRSIGLSSKWLVRDEESDETSDEKTENPKPAADQQIPDLEDAFLIRQPSLSIWSNPTIELPKPDLVIENFQEESSMNQSFDFGLSSSSQKETINSSLLDRRKKVKKGWLHKLNIISRLTDHESESTVSNGATCTLSVPVHTNKKKSKELSSLYATQDFEAHKGSISVLKFSHDGRYLASAGDDGIVKIWEISEHDDPRKYEIKGNDTSSLYFSSNHLSELAPIKEKNRRIRKSSDLACVIIPPKVFRISEKPVHEFHGHEGEILSLSWSKSGCLLSSSVDKTVRMWKIGYDECLKVFTHNNYVTCVEFNPVDENYVITGSIDGKIRIWEASRSQVIDWIEIRDLVTAICYYANGKGCIVGTLDGNCSFYDIIDKRLHLDAQICVMSKKKWPRRITGFQFCPTDARKVIVSSADSQIRVLCGINVVGKFKGNRSSGSQKSASFTADGKHIVSAGDDSNIYIWNHVSSDKLDAKPKSNVSYETFFSQDASVAIPWCGIKTIAAAFPSPRLINTADVPPRSRIDSPRIPSSGINRSHFLDSLLKTPATWPAEALPHQTQVCVSPSMRKSEYRFLRSAYRNTFVAPHTWGLVIVAAGLDGRIRTYVNYGLPVRV